MRRRNILIPSAANRYQLLLLPATLPCGSRKDGVSVNSGLHSLCQKWSEKRDSISQFARLLFFSRVKKNKQKKTPPEASVKTFCWLRWIFFFFFCCRFHHPFSDAMLPNAHAKRGWWNPSHLDFIKMCARVFRELKHLASNFMPSEKQSACERASQYLRFFIMALIYWKNTGQQTAG